MKLQTFYVVFVRLKWIKLILLMLQNNYTTKCLGPLLLDRLCISLVRSLNGLADNPPPLLCLSHCILHSVSNGFSKRKIRFNVTFLYFSLSHTLSHLHTHTTLLILICILTTGCTPGSVFLLGLWEELWSRETLQLSYVHQSWLWMVLSLTSYSVKLVIVVIFKLRNFGFTELQCM